jgi:TolB-like protein/Flp pilus assembly protein TadD
VVAVDSVASRGPLRGLSEVGGDRLGVAVRLFGSFRVTRNGERAGLPASRKVRALLAYLVMARRPVHRAKLCERFWDVPNDPRGALRWRLSKIRGLLGDPSQDRVTPKHDWVSIDTSTIDADALPFANISGDPEQEYFVDGVTESLTTDFSRISGCFVIARNTAFAYKGKPVDARTIGRELNVRYVMEGSVQRSGARMRVNVQLIDAESSAHLWSDRFDKPLADLFDMQDEIVSRLARQLDAALIAAEARRAARSPNPGAIDLYFQGLAWINKGQELEYISRARGFFEHALTLDPGNIEALVGLATVDVDIAAAYVTDDRWQRFVDAETALTEALSMAPDHALAHQVIGVVQICTNRAAQGIAECERALALDPNLAEAHAAIGMAKYVIGRFEETETHIQEAMRISRRDRYLSPWFVMAGIAQLYLGSEEKAVDCFRRSIQTSRNLPAAPYYLAGTLALLGRLEEAQSAVRAAIALHPDFTVSRFRAAAMSDNPRYLAARERLCEGLLKAGVPEG